MEPQGRDSLQVLEQRRAQLEQEIAVIETTLAYWKDSETDYEIIKENVELEDEDDAPWHEKAMYLDRDWVASGSGIKVLKEGDLKSLFFPKDGPVRSFDQILNLIKHRIDYVQGNIESITKRKNALENKLRSVEVLIQPDMADEDGLPLIEITEELDEDGNIISSSISDPNKDATTLFQDLESKGLTGNDDEIIEPTPETKDVSAKSITSPSVSSPGQTKALNTRATIAEAAARAKADELAAGLDDDEEEEEEPVYQYRDPTESAQMNVATLLNSIADIDESNPTDLGPGLKMKDNSHFRSVPRDSLRRGQFDAEPIIPEDENAEDAALRRQMLEYSPYEVGAVVASMDFEEDDDEDFDDDDDDDEEDQYGRSTKSFITDEYRQQMLELEKQLNVKNLGPQPGLISPVASDDEPNEEAGYVHVPSPTSIPVAAPVVSSLVQPAAKKEKKPGKAKGVRFAEEVDVSSGKKPAVSSVSAAQQEFTADLSDKPAMTMREDIVERKPQAKLSVSPEVQKRKVSRFKAAREPKESPAGPGPSILSKTSSNTAQATRDEPLSGSAPNKIQPITDDHALNFAGPLLSTTTDAPKYTPEGPVGKTHADVLERPQSEIRAPEPGDDDMLTRQALATEYYRQRNNKIYQQGGFQAEDPAEIPLDENGEEVRPRISRFKAARIGKSGN